MWTYKGHQIKDLPEDIVGFVYCIYYTDGRKYIGKKLTKKQVKLKPRKNDRINARRVVERESDWRVYNGSSKHTKELTIHSKVILHLCTSKRTVTYLEEKELFAVDAPVNKEYINETISRRYYDNALEGLYEGPVDIQGGLFEQD